MSKRSVEEWRRVVFRSHRLKGNVQVLLLLMAEYMRSDRHVSVPRSELAARLGIHEQRVADRIKVARDRGFLGIVSRGYREHTAEYQGTFPNPEAESVRSSSTQETPRTRMQSTIDCVPDGEFATTRADLSLSGTDRHVGNDEEPEDRPSACGLTVCDCHGFTDCASLPQSTAERSPHDRHSRLTCQPSPWPRARLRMPTTPARGAHRTRHRRTSGHRGRASHQP